MLTPKQEKFCCEYLRSGNASEAYRQSYNCEKMKPASVNRKAFELLKNVNITARIASSYSTAIRNAELTIENHLYELAALRDFAKASGQYSAAIRAEELRGKVAGFYTDRIEMNNKVKMVVLED